MYLSSLESFLGTIIVKDYEQRVMVTIGAVGKEATRCSETAEEIGHAYGGTLEERTRMRR